MTKHPTRSIDEDSKTRMGDYWSRTLDIDIAEPARFKMYRPSCRKMVDQTKSFWMKDGLCTDEPCVRFSKCGLVYDCDHYKKLMREERSQLQKQEQRQQKLENEVLQQNKGCKI